MQKKPETSLFSKIIVWQFHFLLFSLPFVFSFVNEELFEVPKMLFVYAMTITITASWILRMVWEKKIIFKKTFFDIPILIFLASQILSTIFSIHPRTSLFGYYSRMHGGLLSTISYIILYYALVSNLRKKHFFSLIFALLSSGFLVSLYAIPEHFGHSPSCLLMFQKFDVSCWKQDVQTRVFATLGQPNWLAAYVTVLLPISVSLFITPSQKIDTKQSVKAKKKKEETKKKNFWFLVFYLLVSTSLFTTLLFTRSRSGFIAFVVSFGILILGLLLTLLNKLSTKQLTNSVIRKMILLVSSFLFLALIFGTPYTPSLREISNKQITNYKDAESATGGTDSGDIRMIVWKGAFKVWQRYPIFGSGVETFAYSYYQDRPVEHNLTSEWDFLYNKAHNEFLNYLATTGIVGLTAYLIVIGAFIVRVTKLLSNKVIKSQNVTLLALLSGFIALNVTNFFGFSTVTVGLLFFMFPALLELMQEAGGRRQDNKQNLAFKHISNPAVQQFFKLAISAIIILITCNLLLITYKLWLADVYYANAIYYSQNDRYLDAIDNINYAIQLNGNEAQYYNQLSSDASKITLALFQEDEPNMDLVEQLMTQTLLSSDITYQLNPVNLNFYKTRTKVFLTLSQISPEFLQAALDTTNQAISLSPTDPYLEYQLSIINEAMENNDEAIAALRKAIELKSDYKQARLRLGKLYLQNNQLNPAKEQYQYILEMISPEDELVKEINESIEASLEAEINK